MSRPLPADLRCEDTLLRNLNDRVAETRETHVDDHAFYTGALRAVLWSLPFRLSVALWLAVMW